MNSARLLTSSGISRSGQPATMMLRACSTQVQRVEERSAQVAKAHTRERKRERRERDAKRDRVCVCVCERERERENMCCT
jgi:hypothetical protein